MEVHRRQSKCGREHGRDHQDEIDTGLEGRQIAEPLLKCDGEQEPGEDLRTRLGNSQFLQDLVPVAVHPFVYGLVTAIRRIGVSPLIRGPTVRHRDSSAIMFTLLGVKTRAVGCLNIWVAGEEMPAPASSGEPALCHADSRPTRPRRPVGRHFS